MCKNMLFAFLFLTRGSNRPARLSGSVYLNGLLEQQKHPLQIIPEHNVIPISYHVTIPPFPSNNTD